MMLICSFTIWIRPIASMVAISSTGLREPDLGFQADNGLFITTTVTTKLDARTKKDEVKNNAVFQYTLRDRQVDGLQGVANTWTTSLYKTDIYDCGLPYLCTEKYYNVEDVQKIANTTAIPFRGAGVFGIGGPGINRTLEKAVFLNEYYKVPYEGCWTVGFRFGCKTYTIEGTNHIPLGEYFVFDILPSTVAGFARLDWADFPKQTDHDNDGLLSLADGGTDTNDFAADQDGDGLWDSVELRHGFDETKSRQRSRWTHRRRGAYLQHQSVACRQRWGWSQRLH